MSSEEVLKKFRGMCKEHGPLCEGCDMEDFCLFPSCATDEEIKKIAKAIDEFEEKKEEEN